MKRRSVLQLSLASALLGLTARAVAQGRAPRILLRNSWQVINIGDIGHTVGMLRLIKTNVPNADVVLWPSTMDEAVLGLLREVWPALVVLDNSKPAMLTAAIQDCDFLLHGSGSGFVAQKQVQRWSDETDKPYGVFGISLQDIDDKGVQLLSAADFVYFRDSRSWELAIGKGVTAPVMDFGPDSTFAFDAPRRAMMRQHRPSWPRTACKRAGSCAAYRAIASLRCGKSTRTGRSIRSGTRATSRCSSMIIYLCANPSLPSCAKRA